jgi:5-methylthioadenosine/S-adenosylhomocysteine deaminase
MHSQSETILLPEWIIPIQPRGLVLHRHALVFSHSVITDLVPEAELGERYAGAPILNLPGQVLLPGFVNLHTHAGMTLLRGYADDLPLMEWLQTKIWPAEAQWTSPAFVDAGTQLACAEFLLRGITTFNEMYFFPEASAEAILASGLRAVIGLTVLEFPTHYASDAADYLNKGLAARDALRHESRLSFALAPHAPYTVSDATFEKITTFAEQLDLPIHIHIHETEHEITESLKQHGVRPIMRLAKCGLVSPRLIAVHAVHLEPSEIDLFARQGVSMAHCPHSNLKLASGIAPIAALLSAGVNVGIGTDSAASNNQLDLLGELRTAALLAKGISGDASVLPAAQALELATLGGAKALGLQDRIGSIEIGKQADLISIQLQDSGTLPVFDPITQIVYSSSHNQIQHVWVAGEHLLNQRRPIKSDHQTIQELAQQWGRKIKPH